MRRAVRLALSLALAVPLVGAAAVPAHAAAATPSVVPALRGWAAGTGSFTLTAGSRILVSSTDTPARQEAATLAADLRALTGWTPAVVLDGTPATGDVTLAVDPARTALGAEGYDLTVGATAQLVGRTAAGAFYGTRTLLQMQAAGRTVAAGHVTDVPRYAERGVTVCACMIHVSEEWLGRQIRDMAYHKLNYLLLELKVASAGQPSTAFWGYYTTAEITRIVALAATYHVTVVPEINGPGHMEPWLANLPDLQLADSAGVKQPGRLDVTKPAAYTFYTGLIDEYLNVFPAPYWHLGADEYMIGSDYGRYPQMLAYARAKFGANAVAQDAYVDFVNRINAYVKGKGRATRIWNDGLTGANTVPVDADVLVEHWLNVSVKPATLIAQGHPVMNSAYSLYLVRGGFQMDTAALYGNGWNPRVFEGQTLTSDAGITGAKLSLWPDDGQGNTENEVEAQLFMPLNLLAQMTWDPTRPDATYAGFEARARTIGHAPGFAAVNRQPLAGGTYTIAAGAKVLTVAGTAAGSGLAATAGATATWALTPTADGYYQLRNSATGLCAETRLGTRTLNVPLQEGTPITAETCGAGTLQRWEVRPVAGGYRLTNAVTQMLATVRADNTVVQLPPDKATAAAWTLTPQARLAQSLIRVRSVDSAETAQENGAGANVLDGNPATYWHTQWSGTPAPLPHEIVLDLGASYPVTALYQLPRQNSANGRIGGYEVYVSADGATWGTPAATGTWANSAAEQPVTFAARTGRYVRLRALTEVNGNPWTSVAELNVGVAAGSPGRIGQSGMSVRSFDSQETTGENAPAGNVLDGDAGTFWHTRWSSPAAPMPHELVLDLGGSYAVSCVHYLPRQNSANGRIAGYEVYVSADAATWGTAVATGTWANSAAEQSACFAPKPGGYLRLRALSEVNGNPWTTVAELNVTGTAS